jgi:hypothetical protein
MAKIDAVPTEQELGRITLRRLGLMAGGIALAFRHQHAAAVDCLILAGRAPG